VLNPISYEKPVMKAKEVRLSQLRVTYVLYKRVNELIKKDNKLRNSSKKEGLR